MKNLALTATTKTWFAVQGALAWHGSSDQMGQQSYQWLLSCSVQAWQQSLAPPNSSSQNGWRWLGYDRPLSICTWFHLVSQRACYQPFFLRKGPTNYLIDHFFYAGCLSGSFWGSSENGKKAWLQSLVHASKDTHDAACCVSKLHLSCPLPQTHCKKSSKPSSGYSPNTSWPIPTLSGSSIHTVWNLTCAVREAICAAWYALPVKHIVLGRRGHDRTS